MLKYGLYYFPIMINLKLPLVLHSNIFFILYIDGSIRLVEPRFDPVEPLVCDLVLLLDISNLEYCSLFPYAGYFLSNR